MQLPWGAGDASAPAKELARISRRISTFVPPKKERWINSQQASVLFGGTILLNAIILGVETDHRPEARHALSQPIWFAIDSAFNAIYLFECILRLEADRTSWCCDPWNIFDSVLVLIGITDVWIIGLSGMASDIGVLSSIMRIIRLLRLTRLIRMVRMFPSLQELWLLLNAIIGAMVAMAWSLFLISAVLFISAMFTTRLVGQDCCTAEDDFSDPLFQEWFGTVPRSLFTLFQVATLENWPIIARQAFDESPILVLFIIAFIILTNIMLFNTVAGIVVENVLSVAQREEERQVKVSEEEKRQELQDLFDRMDTDNDGMLEWSELSQRKASPSRSCSVPRANSKSVFGRGAEAEAEDRTMLEATLQHANLSALDAKELYRMLDTDGSGSISKEEFVASVMFASVPPTAMNLLQLSGKVNRTGGQLKSVASQLRRLDNTLCDLSQQVPSSQKLGRLSSPLPTVLPPLHSTDASAAELAELRQDMLEGLGEFEERLMVQLRLKRLQGLQQLQCATDTWVEEAEAAPLQEAPDATWSEQFRRGDGKKTSIHL